MSEEKKQDPKNPLEDIHWLLKDIHKNTTTAGPSGIIEKAVRYVDTPNTGLGLAAKVLLNTTSVIAGVAVYDYFKNKKKEEEAVGHVAPRLRKVD